jgi:hypothetical protein
MAPLASLILPLALSIAASFLSSLLLLLGTLTRLSGTLVGCLHIYSEDSEAKRAGVGTYLASGQRTSENPLLRALR